MTVREMNHGVSLRGARGLGYGTALKRRNNELIERSRERKRKRTRERGEGERKREGESQREREREQER